MGGGRRRWGAWAAAPGLSEAKKGGKVRQVRDPDPILADMN